MCMQMRSFVYSSLGQRAISQLLFGSMFGSPDIWQLKCRLFCRSIHFSFLLFLTYSFLYSLIFMNMKMRYFKYK